ncbi:hypothetical protein OAE28_00480 [bacterium]|nr:hypothetical protein [bacterium]
MRLILSSEWVSTRFGDVIAELCDYFLEMTRTDAQKELERIEQELNATAAPPADESRIARVNRKLPHLDAVLIGVVALLAASFLLPIIKSLNDENIDSLSAGTLGGAIGLAVGYGIGRIRK